MKALSELGYDALLVRAREAARLPALDDDGDDYAGLDVLELEVRSGYGQVAVTSDGWLRERANAVLAGLPDAPRPVDALRRLTDDEREIVLIEALYEIDLERASRHLRAFDPTKHKRWLKPHPKAGKFRPMIDLLKEAISAFDPKKDKHPFELFTRPQLLKVARDRGIKLKKGESQDSIADKILADLGAPLAKVKAPKDNLDDLSDQDLLDLAAEYGVKYLGRTREDIIADLRPAIAAQNADADADVSPLTGKPASESAWAKKALADAVAATPSSSKKSTKTTGLKVTTTPWPGKPFAGSKTSLFVLVDGDHVGAVHEGQNGDWTATPIGKLPGWVKPPKGATKEQAIKSLTDVIKAQAAASQAKAAVDAAIKAGDFSGLKRVGPQAGFNEGGVFEADDGSRWYVKAQPSAVHAKNEAQASALYRAAGVDVPEVMRGTGTPGLPGESHTATRMVEGAQANLEDKLSDGSYVDQIRRGFAVDAWLANWDVVGAGDENPWANIVEGGDGRPHRIDVGGALLFGGAGGEKGDAFGKSVVEWATLRDPARAPRASEVFAGITPDQLRDSAKLVEKIKPAQIRQIVDDPALAQLLIDRRKDLLARAKKIKIPDFEARVAKAAADEKALEAGRIKLVYPGSGITLEGDVPVHWTTDEFDNTADALSGYRGSDYVGINDSLRMNLTPDSDTKWRIESIDRAMSASKLQQDIVVYRGITSPAAVFGNAWVGSGSKVGLTYTDPAFTSTTADRRVAASDDFNSPGYESAVMRMIVPRGVGAVRLSDMAPGGMAPASISHEAELLLERGLTFRVVADHGYDGTTQTRILDVEVVPV